MQNRKFVHGKLEIHERVRVNGLKHTILLDEEQSETFNGQFSVEKKVCLVVLRRLRSLTKEKSEREALKTVGTTEPSVD